MLKNCSFGSVNVQWFSAPGALTDTCSMTGVSTAFNVTGMTPESVNRIFGLSTLLYASSIGMGSGSGGFSGAVNVTLTLDVLKMSVDMSNFNIDSLLLVYVKKAKAKLIAFACIACHQCTAIY